MKEDIHINVPQKDSKVTSSILDAFDLLRGLNDEVKLNGGIKIISQLQDNEDDKDVKYAVKRLIRSLGANVPDARVGYFATLVTLLATHAEIQLEKILALIKTELHASGSSKSEVGDVAFGQILVCGAVLRSGLMLKCSADEQQQVMQLLMTASQKKSYLTTVAFLILLDFVKKLNEDQFGTIVWSNIKQEFKKDIKDHNLDSLYFLLIVSNQFPSKVKLRKLIGVPELLCEDTIHAICEKLMAGVDFGSLSHPIYKEIGERIANSPHLKLFWTSGIDSQMTKHNRNRELVSINMLTTILTNIKENLEILPELLSPNFFKLFMDWFKGLKTASKIRKKRENEDDHKLMIKKERELLIALSKAMKLEGVTNAIRLEVLKKLLFCPGEMNFAEITGTTVVKSIVSDLDRDGVKKMAKFLKYVLLNSSKKMIKEDVERTWYNSERVKAADLISHLVTHEAIKDDSDFKLTYMKLLMCFGFFKIGGDENLAISNELSGAIKNCFYRCFTARFSNVDSLVAVLSSLCEFICGILKKEEVRTKMEKQFPEENMQCWEMLMNICQSIEKSENKSKVDKVFLILLYQLGLFLFSEPTYVKMARSSIKELKSCYQHYKSSNVKVKKKKVSISTDEPEWIEVLIEVLLSILSTESSVLRLVVKCVFRLLWEYLTPSSVGQIVSILDPESEDNPLTDELDEESEDEGASDEEQSSDENEENGEEKCEDEESDSGVEDEDDDDPMKTPEQLRMAVQKALGAAAPESDAESVDADMITEEEGKKLDEALAEAFRQFQKGKGKATKKERRNKKALSDFRIRVLDLIDIYLEKDPAMDICLGMIAPLTRCLEICISDGQFRELEQRVRKTIKILTKIRKFNSTGDITVDILVDYMKSVIDKGSRSHFMFQALGDVITYVATFIIHCAQKIDPNGKSLPLINICKEALQSYFQNRSCLLPIIFFHNILQIDWEGNYELVLVILENVFRVDVRQFRRNEGIELITGFYHTLKRNKPISDKMLQKISKLEEVFVKKLTEALNGNTGFQAKKNFFVGLNKLIKSMKMFYEKSNVGSSNTLDFSIISEIIDSSKDKVIVKDSKQPEGRNQDATSKMTRKKKKRKNKQANGQEPPPKRNRTHSQQSNS